MPTGKSLDFIAVGLLRVPWACPCQAANHWNRLLRNLCYAVIARQPLLRNLCYAIFAMKSLLCNHCSAIVALQSSLRSLCEDIFVRPPLSTSKSLEYCFGATSGATFANHTPLFKKLYFKCTSYRHRGATLIVIHNATRLRKSSLWFSTPKPPAN